MRSLRNIATTAARLFALPIMVLALPACGGSSVPDAAQTGFGLHVPEGLSADVAAVHFSATRAACDPSDDVTPYTVTAEVSLFEMYLAEFPSFVNPLDANTIHRFTDSFMMLEVGCYDIYAQPVDATGANSTECLPAWALGQEVFDGQVTDVFLLIQCRGELSGAVDVTVAINQAPTLVDLEYTPAKFVRGCEPVQVCATAEDPDGDPLTFRWAMMSGSLGMTPVAHVDRLLSATECIEMVPTVAGFYEFQVIAYDMMRADDGSMMRVEDWFTSHGYGSYSQDEQNFPLYVAECPFAN